jgi:hypothetical protein
MHPDEEREEAQPHPLRVLDAESGTFDVEGSSAPLWLTASFAREWYEDSLAEARAGDTFQHCRREILFAVCAVESYLLEWVRDDVLSRDFTALNTYFAPNARRGITEKWKDVLKDLHSNGLISKYPDTSTRVWQDFVTLVGYRDGFVHARVSRPETAGLPKNEQPLPSKSDRNTIAPGWATRIVNRLIAHLHAEIGTQPPVWLTEP